MDPKPKRKISRAYLAYVRQQPCVICRESPVDADHLSSRGFGSAKRVDFYAVPLCRQHHSERHAIGSDSFAEKYAVDLWRECARMIIEYFESRISKYHQIQTARMG